MINRVRLLRNIGHFESVDAEQNIALSRLVLIYAENGRGKTTLSAVLRSLATGDPVPINERRRLGAEHAPQVIVDCTGGPPAMFQNGAWNRTIANMMVFDDVFVDENVCSGLDVDPAHRQRLHEVILGARGVALARRLQALAERVVEHNRDLRARAEAVPVNVRGALNVDQFCDLQPQADLDAAILAAEQRLAAITQQATLQNTAEFQTIRLPAIDVRALEQVLGRSLEELDARAAEAVQAHFAALGDEAEHWVAEGMRLGEIQVANHLAAHACPFCAQMLGGAALVEHYRAYFGEEYAELKRSIENALASLENDHGDAVTVQFERAFRSQRDRHAFWARFCEVPALGVQAEELSRAREAAAVAVRAVLRAKRAAPLDRQSLSDADREAIDRYQAVRLDVLAEADRHLQCNEAVRAVKQRAAAGDAEVERNELARLRLIRARYIPDVAAACQAYLDEKVRGLRRNASRLKRVVNSTTTAPRHSRGSRTPSISTCIVSTRDFEWIGLLQQTRKVSPAARIS
jgi:hypothetical protein